jgi:hypothetical protein
MANRVNSFDVFDTLIARRCVEPHNILSLLETRSGHAGLAAARIAADRRLGEKGQPYTLVEMWRELGRAIGLADDVVAGLLALELQIEHEEVIPVIENLAQVRDGDLLVSDTYMAAETVHSLLQRAGLDRRVALVLSNDGKFRGWIWPQLQSQLSIRQHLGDNPHSDGQTPTEAGIPAVIYTGARRSQIEQFLTEQSWPRLAELIREVRLANPFPTSQADERYLWLLGCQLNFPLLLFGSAWIEQQLRDAPNKELLYVSRDGLMWHELHQRLFPERKSTYFYTSRLCLLKPSTSYRDYFSSTWNANAVIVDLCSTGASWAKCFASLGRRAQCLFLGHIDNASYMADALPSEEWLEMTTVFRTSELAEPTSKKLEMLNYAPHPSVEDVLKLPGGSWLPILAETLEYDAKLPQAVRQAFSLCVEKVASLGSPTWHDQSLELLIRAMVAWICDDPHLGRIYSGHFAADTAYEQRLKSQ